MQVDFKIKMSDKLFLRDPESTEIGRYMVTAAVKLMAEMGYEQFTFRKLANEISSTEATIYRYFENKHKLLIYLVDWYWSFMEFQVMYQLNNLTDAGEKIRKVIDILVWEDNASTDFSEMDVNSLYYIAIAEGSKTYLSKNVDDNNKEMLFKPYKDLCARIADLFKGYNKHYPYPATLASTLVETSHLQYYFMHHLPRLCDFSNRKHPKDLEKYLEHLVFAALDV